MEDGYVSTECLVCNGCTRTLPIKGGSLELEMGDHPNHMGGTQRP